MKYNIGLFHGRFEHVHKGHQKIIDRMLKECKKSIILVGNCQALRTERNPFTILERINLIKKIYGNKNNLIIGFFPDLPNVPKSKKEYENWEKENKINKNTKTRITNKRNKNKRLIETR